MNNSTYDLLIIESKIDNRKYKPIHKLPIYEFTKKEYPETFLDMLDIII